MASPSPGATLGDSHHSRVYPELLYSMVAVFQRKNSNRTNPRGQVLMTLAHVQHVAQTSHMAKGRVVWEGTTQEPDPGCGAPL